MIARRATALAALPALFFLAACTSSGGKPKASPSSSVGPAAVAAQLAHGIAGIRTAQAYLDATFGGQQIAGNGPATFADGRLTALDVSATVPGVGHLHLRLVAGKAYAQLPATLNPSGKPWVIVTPNSSNVVIAQLGSVLGEVESAASLTNLTALVGAAASVQVKGSETVHGTSATHYSFLVDAAKLPASFPERSDLLGALKNTPTELWLDSSGRPVQARRVVLALGQQVDVTLGAADFNAPVTITPPPAGDVATG